MMQPASKLCDVYSYGIMLWEMFTHDKPFKGIPPLYIPLKVGEGLVSSDCKRHWTDLSPSLPVASSDPRVNGCGSEGVD